MTEAATETIEERLARLEAEHRFPGAGAVAIMGPPSPQLVPGSWAFEQMVRSEEQRQLRIAAAQAEEARRRREAEQAEIERQRRIERNGRKIAQVEAEVERLDVELTSLSERKRVLTRRRAELASTLRELTR